MPPFRTIGRTVILSAVLACALHIPLAAADLQQNASEHEAHASVPATAPAPAVSLPDRQQDVNDRLERLQTQMLKLARLLAEKDPAKTERLRAALQQQGESEVTRKLERILALLQTAEFSDADATQQQAVADLARMLEALNDTGSDLARKREERERLAELRQSVQRLMDAQVDALQKTRSAAQKAALLQQLNEQAAALEALAQEQAKLRGEKGVSAASAPARSDGAPEPADATRDPAPAAGLSAEANAAQQKELAQRAGRSAQALREASGQSREAQSSRAASEAAESIEAAQKAMEDAAQQLETSPSGEQSSSAEASEQPQNAAEAAQQKAEAALGRAIRRLRDEARRLSDRREIREIERQQRSIEQQGGGAEDQMRQGKSDGKPQAGLERMGRARNQMQQSADRLGERDPQGSAQPQTEALQELQQTLNELSDALRQTREEEMEETLGALEARFRAILAKQEQLREGLTPLSQRVAPSRADELALLDLAKGQATLAQETGFVRQLLVDEGTTLILPELVGGVVADMNAAAARLEQQDVSAASGQLMESILAALREILGALEQRRAEMSEQQQQPPGNQQRGPAALLPNSAELKLVKASQVRINTETAQSVTSADSGTAARLNALAQRQSRLVELTRQMHERR